MTITQEKIIKEIAEKEDINVATVRKVFKRAEKCIFAYYDVKKYNYGKHNNLGDNNYLKTNYAHIGVSITAHKIYIEDKYVK